MQDFFIPSLIFCFFGASGRYFKISFKQVLTTALKLNIIYPLHPRCINRIRGSAGIGRQARLRGVCCMTYGFKSHLPHHKETHPTSVGCVFLSNKRWMGLEEAAVNDVPVARQSRADRGPSRAENPVPSTAPQRSTSYVSRVCFFIPCKAKTHPGTQDVFL